MKGHSSTTQQPAPAPEAKKEEPPMSRQESIAHYLSVINNEKSTHNAFVQAALYLVKGLPERHAIYGTFREKEGVDITLCYPGEIEFSVDCFQGNLRKLDYDEADLRSSRKSIATEINDLKPAIDEMIKVAVNLDKEDAQAAAAAKKANQPSASVVPQGFIAQLVVKSSEVVQVFVG